MAPTDTLKAVPDQLLELLDVTQQTILTNASAFVATATSLVPETAVIPYADHLPNPVGLSDGAFTFAEKVLASQREFSHKLIEMYLPAKPSAPVKASAARSAG